MASSEPRKRVRRDPETTRALILDMTEKLMVEEGYAAVSSRRIAQELGLNAATVHYYYPTTDDIFIALHRRLSDRQVQGLESVIAADNPLEAFWKLQSGQSQTALGVEFLALANHRKAICETLAGSADAAREAQAQSLQRVLGGLPIDWATMPPIAIATILVAVGRLLANEERVGITQGHHEVRLFIDWALGQITRPTDGG